MTRASRVRVTTFFTKVYNAIKETMNVVAKEGLDADTLADIMFNLAQAGLNMKQAELKAKAAIKKVKKRIADKKRHKIQAYRKRYNR